MRQRTFLLSISENINKETMDSRKSRYHITTTTTTPVTTITTTTRIKSVGVVMVMGMVMMGMGVVEGASSSRTGEPDLRRLWERVTSHTETLRNINRYLKQTDIFWGWFQENKGRLDEILSAGSSTSSPANDRLLQRLDDLERKQKVRDAEMQEMQRDLQQEREKTARLEARLRHQEETEDLLRREIPEFEERMAQLEAQLVVVNQTTQGNKRDLDGRVTADLHDLQQKTDNLMEVVDQFQSTVRDELNGLKGLLEEVMVNSFFPLEEQVILLNQSHFALSEEAKQEIIEVKADIRSLSAKVSSKQGGRNRGLQTQITNLQTSISTIQGTIGQHDGRINSLQHTNSQLQEALKEHSRLGTSVDRIRNRLSKLEEASGNMNLELKKTVMELDELEKDVTYLKQYNLTDHVRRVSVLNADPTSHLPIGPPGRGFEGGFGRPGNQGWRGEPGDPGSRGPPGTRGAPGSPGSRGEQGSPGAPGDRGAPGIPGLRGGQGSPGSRGAPGNRGAPGSPGSRGTPGERGAPGIPGASGGRGAPGIPGPRGAPGGRGASGNSGTSGVRGNPGMPGNAGLRGPAGSPGMRGPPGNPGYPGGTSYPGFRGYTSYRSSPAPAEYSATAGYGRYPSTARYGGYYQG